jgi:hypothetical protein
MANSHKFTHIISLIYFWSNEYADKIWVKFFHLPAAIAHCSTHEATGNQGKKSFRSSEVFLCFFSSDGSSKKKG